MGPKLPVRGSAAAKFLRALVCDPVEFRAA